MKIIGTSEAGLLISASEDEIANLIGYYSKYGDQVRNALRVGTEIRVSEMFKKLYEMQSMEKELVASAAKLRMCADTITLTAPLIPKTEVAPI